MEARELRIGNKVHNNLGITETVLGVNIFEVLVFGGSYNPKDLHPIPLTLDELAKINKKQWDSVGFGTRTIWQHKKFKAIKFEFLPSNQVAIYFNDELINYKDYSHELQNLFNSLTGEELTYTP